MYNSIICIAETPLGSLLGRLILPSFTKESENIQAEWSAKTQNRWWFSPAASYFWQPWLPARTACNHLLSRSLINLCVRITMFQLVSKRTRHLKMVSRKTVKDKFLYSVVDQNTEKNASYGLGEYCNTVFQYKITKILQTNRPISQTPMFPSRIITSQFWE